MNRFITIGGGELDKDETICIAGNGKSHSHSIDLDRFISAKLVKVNNSDL